MDKTQLITIVVAALGAIGGLGTWLNERRKVKGEEPVNKAQTTDLLVNLVRSELEHYIGELQDARMETDELRNQLKEALMKIDQLHLEVSRLTRMVQALGGEV